jgi:hypothetical protein
MRVIVRSRTPVHGQGRVPSSDRDSGQQVGTARAAPLVGLIAQILACVITIAVVATKL